MVHRIRPRFCLSHAVWRGDPATSTRIHASLVWAVWGRRIGWWRRLRLVLRTARWPVEAVGYALVETVRYGPSIRRRTGKGLARQLVEQIRLAATHGIPPTTYYVFRLYEDDKRARAGSYLHRYETKNYSLYRLLQRRTVGAFTNPLSDKHLFFERCRDAGLPTPPVLLLAADGKLGPDPCAALPPHDLFVKPRKGKGGRGAARWSWLGDGRYRQPGGDAVDAAALLVRWQRDSVQQPLLVMPRCVNHPAIRDLTSGALTTARIVTILDEAGEPEPVAAVFRMAVEDPVVDNIHAGGIASAVDLKTGRLGPATSLDPREGWLEAHPETCAPIAGRTLPLWPEALDLVRRAHAAFGSPDVIGWDVGLCEDGPVLIEGNASPCVELLQRPLDRGLGDDRFGELFAMHLDRLRDDGPAAAWARSGLPEGEIDGRTEAALLRQRP